MSRLADEGSLMLALQEYDRKRPSNRARACRVDVALEADDERSLDLRLKYALIAASMVNGRG